MSASVRTRRTRPRSTWRFRPARKYVHTFPRDGFYDVGCDIHPGMSAQIVSSDSPYTAVADAEGNFLIENVPAGSSKAIIYAGAQKIEKPLTVAGGQTTFNVTP